MRITKEQKQRIEDYILEKVAQGQDNVAAVTAANFDITRSAVYNYLKSLMERGIIRKSRRNRYELVQQRHTYTLLRSKGEFQSDVWPFTTFVKPEIESFSDNVGAIWAYCFSEMFNNVIDHSQAEEARIDILKDHLSTTVILTDNGIGIFKKLKEHFALNSYEEAICELFKGKLTTDAANHSGEGIFFSSKMMDTFLILSDGCSFSCDRMDDTRITEAGLLPDSGTLVFMKLSNQSPKKPKEIFDQYASVEGGFTRTRIPLRYIFDGDPVSRSQAKRVCARLEQFEEVTLDFEGISWIGQGFAHQIFQVFQKEHPEITLHTENAQPDVQRMITHVTV